MSRRKQNMALRFFETCVIIITESKAATRTGIYGRLRWRISQIIQWIIIWQRGV